jgi:hypothetical protein
MPTADRTVACAWVFVKMLDAIALLRDGSVNRARRRADRPGAAGLPQRRRHPRQEVAGSVL